MYSPSIACWLSPPSPKTMSKLHGTQSDNDSHLLSNADTCLDRAYPPIDIIVALKGAFDVPFEDVDANFLLRKYGFNPDDVREETVPITTTNLPSAWWWC